MEISEAQLSAPGGNDNITPADTAAAAMHLKSHAANDILRNHCPEPGHAQYLADTFVPSLDGSLSSSCVSFSLVSVVPGQHKQQVSQSCKQRQRSPRLFSLFFSLLIYPRFSCSMSQKLEYDSMLTAGEGIRFILLVDKTVDLLTSSFPADL
jgi:hypothetical protein